MNLDLLPGAVTKPGRKPLNPGTRRVATSVSLTRAQHAEFKRRGGSKWLRSILESASRQEHPAP